MTLLSLILIEHMKYLRKKTALFTIINVLAFSPMMSQDIGIQLYSLRNHIPNDIEGIFKTIRDWDIRYLEGGDTYGLSHQQYQELLKKYHLKMIGIEASFDNLNSDLEKIINQAKQFNVQSVVCFWIPHNGVFAIEDAKKAVNTFNSAGEKLKAHGVTLSYHPHGFEFKPFQEELLIDYLAQNAEHFKFQMDTFWFHHGGMNPVDFFEKYPHLIESIHMKDMKKGVHGDGSGSQSNEDNVVLGTGQIDIAKTYFLAKKHGVRYIIIEDESSAVLDQVPQSVAYLKSLN